jgi:D-alanyl-lipoteichoic acid acyltransferase DltB (MBOAT superfamily)
MLFTDLPFLFLLFPLACVLFYTLTPRYGVSFGLGLLLVVSLLFYAGWGAYYFVLLVCSITANFVAAYFLLTTPDSRRHRRAFLWLGLAYNFGMLFWFKYRLFVVSAFLGQSTQGFSIVDITIPIGISFYTFQQAIFLVDAYYRDRSLVTYLGEMRGLRATFRAYVHHAFFVSFFPHLLIGPIVYLKEFQPQVQSRAFGKFRLRNLEVGLTLIALGLFKKTVLADNLAPLTDVGFRAADAHALLSVTVAWTSALAYYAQLYFDFSGYSDIALGTARVLGIRFPINFFSPLKAVGIMDFYRRWHMTLTRAIARFFYIPLSLVGARTAQKWKLPKMPARLIAQWLPLLLNFEAIALWHGARATFVLFGLIIGIWYVAESELRRTRAWKAWCGRTTDRVRAVLGRAVFFLPIMVNFALFRSSSISSFFYLIRSMFSADLESAHWSDLLNMKRLVIAYAVIWLLPNSIEFLRLFRPGILTYQNRNYGWKPLLFAWRPNWQWATVIGILALVALYFAGRQSPFLYMGF